MERFNLVFSGETCDPLTPETMEPVLSELGFSEEHIARVASGRPLTIKRDILFARAQLVKLALAARGLVTELTVSLDSESLAAGLRYVHRGQQAFSTLEIIHPKLVQPSLAVGKGVYGLQQRRISPVGSLAANDGEPAPERNSTSYLGSISQSGIRITAAGRLLLSLLFALPLQTYILRLLPNIVGSNIAATILGILFFLLMIVILPMLLRPLTLRSIHVSNGPTDIHVVDQWHWGLTQNTFSVYDYRINKLANIVVKKNSVVLSEPFGRVRFKWDLHANIQAAEGALSLITDKAFEGTAIGDISEYWTNFQKLFFFLRPTPCIERVRFNEKHAHIVTDAAGSVAAIIYRNNASVGIAIHEDFKEQSQQLRAMAVVFNDGPLLL